MAGCPEDVDDPCEHSPDAATGDAYVPLLTGKVAQVDPGTLDLLGKLGGGSSIVHGVAVVDGVAWIGNRNTGEIDRFGSDAEQLSSISIGHAINRIVRGGELVAVSGDSPAHPFGASVTFVAADGTAGATTEIPLDEAMMGPTSLPTEEQPTPHQECSTCPRTGVVFHQGTAWVVHTRNHALYRVDPAAGTVGERIDIAKPEGVDTPALSPFLSVSPEGRVAVPGLYTRAVHLFEPAGSLSTAPHLAIEAEWSPDGCTLYVLTAESEVIIGDESHNAAIPTEVLAVDAQTLEVRTRTTHDTALNHITPDPGGAWLFATTTANTLVRFDAVTLTQTGVRQLQAGAPPALDVYF